MKKYKQHNMLSMQNSSLIQIWSKIKKTSINLLLKALFPIEYKLPYVLGVLATSSRANGILYFIDSHYSTVDMYTFIVYVDILLTSMPNTK